MLEDPSEFSLEQFLNLEHFSLGDMPWASDLKLEASRIANILLLPTSLRSVHLCLRYIYGRDISTLCDRFQALDDFSLICHVICPQQQIEDVALGSSPKFRGELKVFANADLTPFATLLQNLPNGIHFDRAVISVPWEQPPTINALLPAIAHTLTSLHVDVGFQGEVRIR
jgi:hypothetical protein